MRVTCTVTETHFSRDTQLTIDWFATGMTALVERIFDGSVLVVAPLSVTKREKTHTHNLIVYSFL